LIGRVFFMREALARPAMPQEMKNGRNLASQRCTQSRRNAKHSVGRCVIHALRMTPAPKQKQQLCLIRINGTAG
jgi:hypothetical protein